VYVFPLVVFSLQRARKKKGHKDEGGEEGHDVYILFGPAGDSSKNPELGTAGIKMGLFEKR